MSTQNPAGGVHVPGLSVKDVRGLEDVITVMAKGYSNRAVGSHNVNEHSSRSHLVLSVDVSVGTVHCLRGCVTVPVVLGRRCLCRPPCPGCGLRDGCCASSRVNQCVGRNKLNGSGCKGRLHLIDLAGSERVGKTDATGTRLTEAKVTTYRRHGKLRSRRQPRVNHRACVCLLCDSRALTSPCLPSATSSRPWRRRTTTFRFEIQN